MQKCVLLRLIYRDKVIENDEYIFYSHEDNKNMNVLVDTFKYSVQDAGNMYVEDFEKPEDVIKYMFENAKEQSKHDSEAVKGFIKGFHFVSKNLYKVFSDNKFNVKDIDIFMTRQQITVETVQKYIIDKLYDIDRYEHDERPIVEAFHKIMKNEISFPTRFVNSQKQQHPDKKYPSNWEEFIEYLLFYWTGKKVLMKQELRLLTRSGVHNPEQNQTIQSQTCFLQLILGTNIGSGEDIDKRAKELYKRLIIECAGISFSIG